MVRKSKIRTLFLLPSALILFLTGWCLQFVGSPKTGGHRKKEIHEIQIGVLEPEEKWICQSIGR
jgi:hypothetical protein